MVNEYGWNLSRERDDYLQHWGVLGMKWGVRRYQNADGSLTEAGKNRYQKQVNKAIDKYNKTHSDKDMLAARNAINNDLANEHKNLTAARTKSLEAAEKEKRRIVDKKEFKDYDDLHSKERVLDSIPKYASSMFFDKNLQQVGNKEVQKIFKDQRLAEKKYDDVLFKNGKSDADYDTNKKIDEFLTEYDNASNVKTANDRLKKSASSGNKDLDSYLDDAWGSEFKNNADSLGTLQAVKTLNARAEENERKQKAWKSLDPKLKRSWEDVSGDIESKSMDWYNGKYKTKRAKEAASVYEKERDTGRKLFEQKKYDEGREHFQKASEALAKAALKDLGIEPTQDNIDWIVDNQIIEWD